MAQQLRSTMLSSKLAREKKPDPEWGAAAFRRDLFRGTFRPLNAEETNLGLQYDWTEPGSDGQETLNGVNQIKSSHFRSVTSAVRRSLIFLAHCLEDSMIDANERI